MPALRAASIAAAAGSILVGSAMSKQIAPKSEVSRSDLLRHDLGVVGREAIQVRVDFAPGADAPQHRHPGEELVYVLKGALEYRLDGSPPVTLHVGEVLFIAAGKSHAVRNVGNGIASELATYIVEKGRPLVVPVK